MNSLRKPLLVAAGAALALGGGAYAASKYTHHLAVQLPDGEIAQVEYVGDVAPHVVLEPVAAVPVPVARVPMMAVGLPDFANFDRIFADMERQQAAMMQQVAQMQRAAAASGSVQTSGRPAHGASWSYVSSTTSANGCTQTVEWHSGGQAAQASQPQVIRTSSGACDKAVKPAPVHEASVTKPAAAVPDNKTV